MTKSKDRGPFSRPVDRRTFMAITAGAAAAAGLSGRAEAQANRTGVDPARVASTPPPQASTEPQGERVRGAARGAVGGAAIGAIAGDTGKGAGIGAVVGTVRGGREARSKQASAQQQANSQQQAQINTYYRAYGACLEGRGYTVK